ncbi:hypothetical protein ACEPAH_1657 [Sanghuangporus vaninii]
MSVPPAPLPTGWSRTQTPMSYEKFKPKFPINPFVGSDQTSSTAREPWTLDADAIPLPSILQHERRVILVIGQPTAAALSPLFASRHLASSLIIIASHRPPALPFDPHPSVYALRLRTPLLVADAGATRLVEILEWALQVARLWRRSGGPKKQELMEEVSPGSGSVPLGQSYGRLRYSVAVDAQQDQMAVSSSAFSPAASVTSLAPSAPKRTRRLSLFRRQSSLPLIPDPASAKPFDALLHFLPAGAPDRAGLKAMILVTTLTRPYLAVPPTRARSTRFYSESSSKLSSSSKSRKRWSFFRSTSNVTSPSNSSSTLSVSSQSKSATDLTEGSRNRRSSLTNLALLRARRSRLIHLMPSAPAPIKASGSSVTPASSRHRALNPNFSTQSPAQAHLIRNIEAFLLSFYFSVSPELPTPIAGFAASDADCGKARPYVLPSMALAEVLRVQSQDDENEIDGEDEESGNKRRNEWSLAELILSGALEGEAESRSSAGLPSGTERKSSESDKGKERQKDSENSIENNMTWMSHRAWIGSVHDIILTHSTSVTRMEKAHIVPPRSSSQPLLPSQSYSRPHPTQFRIPSQPQTQPLSRSQPLSYPMPVQSLSCSDPVSTGQLPTSNSPPRAALYVDTKRRRASKRHGYQSLAIEKRLPTPPEDENEDEEVEEESGLEAEEVDSTISNATSCTRSPYPDDYDSEREMTPRASDWEKNGAAYGRARRHSSERAGSYGYPREGHHRRHDSYSHSGVASPSSAYPSTTPSSTSTSTPSTITRSNTPSHHRSSSRHQYQPEQTPSRRQVYDHVDEDEDTYQRKEKAQQQQQCEKEYLENGSLPTPPDSEKASFEGVPDPVVPSALASASVSSAQPARDRERRYTGVDASRNRASPVKHEHTRSREERKRETVRDAESHSTDKERERRKRASSQPSRPPPTPSASLTPAIDERTPPRRSKTKPKERERRISKDIPPLPLLQDATSNPKSVSRSKPTMERRMSDVGAILNKPLRPDLKRSPASVSSPSSGEGERERERRHAKLEKRHSKPDMRKNGNGASSGKSRDGERGRERRGGAGTGSGSGSSTGTSPGSSASAIKRVPVPAMEDVLPPLPRSSASAPASTSRSPSLQSQHHHHHQQHNVKWKFWKGDVGTGPAVNA